MKIVVAGGGTSGWLTALFVSKIFPEHEITVVENSKIGVIGTGEGSTGLLKQVVKNRIFDFGCNEVDFVKATGSLPKLGINFKNWGVPDYISPIDGSIMQNDPVDLLSYYLISQEMPAHVCGEQGHRIDQGMLPWADTKLSMTGGSAYHFDGVRVGQYFKSLCSRVLVIDDEIIDFQQDSFGDITSIKLQGSDLACDLVIDCLGFNSIFNRRLEKGWVSYSRNLPVNCAIPFQLPNTDLDSTSVMTESTALDHGWMWKIPVGQRFGCGYVFNSDLISPEQAQQEVERHLGHAINPIKIIKFSSGRQKEMWKNNVLSVGLSSGFLEPLQATAIHTIISHLELFCFNYLVDSELLKNQGCKDSFNHKAGKFFDDFADFINLHYQTGREDSEFWRYMKYESATDKVKMVKNIAKSRILAPCDFDLYRNCAGNSLWNPTLINVFPMEKSRADEILKFYSTKIDADPIEIYEHLCKTVTSEKFINISDYIDAFIKSPVDK